MNLLGFVVGSGGPEKLVDQVQRITGNGILAAWEPMQYAATLSKVRA